MNAPYLKEAHLELSSYCNYKCSFCTNPQRQKIEGGVLGWELFQRIVGECKDAGVGDISLHGSGDPSLYKSKDAGGTIRRLPDAIRYCTEQGLNVLINSNCFLFDEQAYTEIIEAGLKTLRVSFHGWDREHYAKFMRNDGFDKVLGDMLAFGKLNARLGGECELHSTHLSYDFQDISIDDQIAQYRKNVVDPVGCLAEVWRLHDWAGNMDPVHQMYSVRKRAGLQRRSCGRPESGVVEIRANGRISICCFDMSSPYYLGDLAEHSLRDIYHGEKYAFVRRVHREGTWEEIPLCDRCDQLYHFDDALAWTNIPGRVYGQSKASKIVYASTESSDGEAPTDTV